MIKVGDKVFHAYNGKIRGIVREIKLSDITHNLDAGTPTRNRIAVVEVLNAGQSVMVDVMVRDLMVDV